MSDLDTILAERFGFHAFLPGQREAIEHLVGGRSVAAVFPTGGGKSLCYQLPAIMLPGVTLVVSPLIALMKDQIDALARRGVEARRLDSTLDADAYASVMSDVREGRVRLLYVAPERFQSERFRRTVEGLEISLFAVDEAHCISEWGHNFRPDYLRLADIARRCRAARILALTATATNAVLDDICRAFEIDRACAIKTGFHRANLFLRTQPVTEAERDDALLAGLASREPGPTIVYVTQQKTAERVAEMLAAAGLSARPYHAGLGNELRAEIQEWFMASERAIVVATIAFGMGIDKADIRAVVHYNLPKSLENYAQEIGRAGRDGEAAVCEMLVCPSDLNVLENFIHGDTPSHEAITSLIDDLASSGSFVVDEYQLSARHDIRGLVLRTLLTYLELEGWLDAGSPFYSSYKFQPRCSSKEILARYEGERRDLIAGVLARSKKARVWFSIEIDTAAAHLGVQRDVVVSVLDELGEQGLLELQLSGIRRQYHWKRAPEDRAQLARSLHERVLARERAELHRLQQVMDLAALHGCQTGYLCAYFDDPLPEPCGHCSWCERGVAAVLPARERPEIDPAIWSEAITVRAEHPDVLSDSRAFARFVCGIGSPGLTRARLGRHRLFGCLAEVPFDTVLARGRSTEPQVPSPG
jgi:ATP-dependent DNA helicase RecQ